MNMRYSTICLASSVICFSVGVLIFGLALFAGMFDPGVAGAIGLILMIDHIDIHIRLVLMVGRIDPLRIQAVYSRQHHRKK